MYHPKKEKPKKNSPKKSDKQKSVEIKKDKLNKTISVTQKDFDLWFNSGRKGPRVAELRNILMDRGFSNYN